MAESALGACIGLAQKVWETAQKARSNREDCETMANMVVRIQPLLAEVRGAASSTLSAGATAVVNGLQDCMEKMYALAQRCASMGPVRAFLAAGDIRSRFRTLETEFSTTLSQLGLVSVGLGQDLRKDLKEHASKLTNAPSFASPSLEAELVAEVRDVTAAARRCEEAAPPGGTRSLLQRVLGTVLPPDTTQLDELQAERDALAADLADARALKDAAEEHFIAQIIEALDELTPGPIDSHACITSEVTAPAPTGPHTVTKHEQDDAAGSSVHMSAECDKLRCTGKPDGAIADATLTGAESPRVLSPTSSVIALDIGSSPFSVASRCAPAFGSNASGSVCTPMHAAHAVRAHSRKAMHGEWRGRDPESTEAIEADAPENYRCPITRRLMADPVMLVATGKTYERAAIARWLSAGHTRCPATGIQIPANAQLVPNIDFAAAIAAWAEARGLVRAARRESTTGVARIDALLDALMHSTHAPGRPSRAQSAALSRERTSGRATSSRALMQSRSSGAQASHARPRSLADCHVRTCNATVAPHSDMRSGCDDASPSRFDAAPARQVSTSSARHRATPLCRTAWTASHNGSAPALPPALRADDRTPASAGAARTPERTTSAPSVHRAAGALSVAGSAASVRAGAQSVARIGAGAPTTAADAAGNRTPRAGVRPRTAGVGTAASAGHGRRSEHAVVRVLVDPHAGGTCERQQQGARSDDAPLDSDVGATHSALGSARASVTPVAASPVPSLALEPPTPSESALGGMRGAPAARARPWSSRSVRC